MTSPLPDPHERDRVSFREWMGQMAANLARNLWWLLPLAFGLGWLMSRLGRLFS